MVAWENGDIGLLEQRGAAAHEAHVANCDHGYYPVKGCMSCEILRQLYRMPTEVNMATTRKRFIAGAQCPQCKTQDTLLLRIETRDGQEHEQVECVHCGHHFADREAEKASPESKPTPSSSLIGIFKPE